MITAYFRSSLGMALVTLAPSFMHSQTPAAKFVDSARVEIDQAVAATDLARLGNAVVLLDRALVAFPDDPYVLHYRGYAAYRQAINKLRNGELSAVSPYVQRGISDLERSSDKLAWPETFALLSAMQAFRIAVDPDLARTVGQDIAALRARATQLGPNNPRVLLLGTYSLMKTPVEWGGGMDVAKAMLVKAIAAFANDKPAVLAPAWGRDELAALQTQLGVAR